MLDKSEFFPHEKIKREKNENAANAKKFPPSFFMEKRRREFFKAAVSNFSMAVFVFFSGAAWTRIVAADFRHRAADGDILPLSGALHRT